MKISSSSFLLVFGNDKNKCFFKETEKKLKLIISKQTRGYIFFPFIYEVVYNYYIMKILFFIYFITTCLIIKKCCPYEF